MKVTFFTLAFALASTGVYAADANSESSNQETNAAALQRLAAPLPKGSFFTVKNETLVPVGTTAEFSDATNKTFCSLYIEDSYDNDILLTPQTKINVSSSAVIRGKITFEKSYDKYSGTLSLDADNDDQYILNEGLLPNKLSHDQGVVWHHVAMSCRIRGCDGADDFVARYNQLNISFTSYNVTIGDSTKPIPAHMDCHKNPSDATLYWGWIGSDQPKLKKVEAPLLADLGVFFDAHLTSPTRP